MIIIALRRAAIFLAAFSAVSACASDGDNDPVKDPSSVARYLLPSNDHDLHEGEIRVTYLGTSTLLFDDGTDQILIDGFVSRPSLVSTTFRRLRSDRDLVNALVVGLPIDRLRAIFVTHSHYDHAMDVIAFIDAVNQRWKNFSVQLYGSDSTRMIGCGGGLSAERIFVVSNGTKAAVGGFNIEAFKSKHADPPWYVVGIGGDIEAPLRQPAHEFAYNEGGTLDYLITHRNHSILVKASANFVEGQLENLRPDVLFFGVGRLTTQHDPSPEKIYTESVKKVDPGRVIGVHWDNFFAPLGPNLPPDTKSANDSLAALAFLADRLGDTSHFAILQGLERYVLFESGSPEARPRPDDGKSRPTRQPAPPISPGECPAKG